MSQEFDYLFSYLDSENIIIDENEFIFQVQSHPDYPYLLSVCDTLSFFNINNFAYKIPVTDIAFDEIVPNKFIGQFEENEKFPDFFFIERTENEYLVNGKTKMSFEKFNKTFTGVILELKEGDFKENREKKKLKLSDTKIFILSILILSSIILFFSLSFLLTVFFIINSIGLFLSIEALKLEFGIDSKVSKKFCTIVSNSDCKQVINSTKTAWLKFLKIGDISFWFFLSQMISIFIFSFINFQSFYFSFLFLSLLFSLPMTFYSIYFQKFVEKKMVPNMFKHYNLDICTIYYLLINFYKSYFFPILSENHIVSYYYFLNGGYFVILFERFYIKKK